MYFEKPSSQEIQILATEINKLAESIEHEKKVGSLEVERLNGVAHGLCGAVRSFLIRHDEYQNEVETHPSQLRDSAGSSPLGPSDFPSDESPYSEEIFQESTSFLDSFLSSETLAPPPYTFLDESHQSAQWHSAPSTPEEPEVMTPPSPSFQHVPVPPRFLPSYHPMHLNMEPTFPMPPNPFFYSPSWPLYQGPYPPCPSDFVPTRLSQPPKMNHPLIVRPLIKEEKHVSSSDDKTVPFSHSKPKPRSIGSAPRKSRVNKTLKWHSYDEETIGTLHTYNKRDISTVDKSPEMSSKKRKL